MSLRSLTPSSSVSLFAYPATLILTISFWLFIQVAPVQAEPAQAPQTCRVGMFITSLRNFKFAEKSFRVDFRVWSVCPSKALNPLDSMEIVNAIDFEEISKKTFEKPNRSSNFTTEKTLYWTQRDLSAVLSQNWDVQNYPFDRHTLKIAFEEGIEDSSRFVYTPDFPNSGYQRSMKVGGWRILDFKLQEERIAYQTTFGDPELVDRKGVYSRLTAAIPIQRDKYLSFFKLTIGVYVAFAVAMLSFFYETRQASLVSARSGLLVGCLFSALVNMRASESVIGRTESLTLVDQIHIIAIVYFFAAALATVVSRITTERGQFKQALEVDRQVLFRSFALSFVILNVIIIGYAAIVG